MSDSFATTRWTLVADAGAGAGSATSHQAMGALCQTYWPPLYAHARRRGLSVADAEDAVQGFFARLFRLESIAEARRERGRFRAFLLGAFNHFLADLHDHARAEKRGVRVRVSFDAVAAETLLGAAPTGHSPDQAFDRAWALTVLDTVGAQLRADHARTERTAFLDALLPCLAGRQADTPHAELAQKLGLTEPAVRVALHRLRQRYRQLLRAEIARTVATPADIDAELRHLLAAVSHSG